MVSAFVSLSLSLSLSIFALLGASSTSPSDLPVGAYFRPTGSDVSGFPDATTKYVRSPCPALNALANHGYLPRDGKNITQADYKVALMLVYNIAEEVANTLTGVLPNVSSLAYLGRHNLIEHDASLAHADVSFKKDPAELDDALWQDLASRAVDGKLGVVQLAGARKDRERRCKAKSTGCEFGLKQRFMAYGESALMLRGLGGNNDESITLDTAESFFVHERIPENYTRPPTPVSQPKLLATIAKIQALSPFQ
ncbi:hypothetical protein P43SY_010849 [Pythium insidiosum]|uniref:Heme haloperoxidase family profile domain-containing protein n=1 Tax=Pythium insidiosum TaxID=114742 RepID=A0AAD5L6G2_PYTIN|nr:hypothetical protein P43SY_010849 [Pythium insidiosum]KAJ0408763.1 hypothetical protein ATCC90586_005514 [Pythium insidiosum]